MMSEKRQSVPMGQPMPKPAQEKEEHFMTPVSEQDWQAIETDIKFEADQIILGLIHAGYMVYMTEFRNFTSIKMRIMYRK